MPRQQRVNHDISIGKIGPAANWTGETRIGAPVVLGRRENVLFAASPQARKLGSAELVLASEPLDRP
jgi:hypothetical protein